MTRLAIPSITESSSLAASKGWPGWGWTNDDEAETPQWCAFKFSEGLKTGSFNLQGISANDCEAIGIDYAEEPNFWAAVTGDNDSNRTDRFLVKVPEPDPTVNHGTISAGVVKYPLRYKVGSSTKGRNIEAFAINPNSGNAVLFTKESSTRYFKFSLDDLVANQTNWLTASSVTFPSQIKYISDAVYSLSGKFLFYRCKGVYDRILVTTSGMKYAGYIPVKKVNQPESVTLKVTGDKLYYGSEGSNSPLGNVTIPTKWR